MLDLPRINLAHLPTSVEQLPRLSERLGGPTLLIKRDDQTGLAFGGNKTRKLEFLIAEAREKGARTLITTGAAQSNHCRQTAAAAARFGFDCILVLTGEQPSKITGNLLLDKLFDADIVWTDRSTRDEILEKVFIQAKEDEKKPYLVPYGGSSPVGTAAYAYMIKELAEQGTNVDWIIHASSSGGTQAGLAAGIRLFNYPARVLGISIDEGRATLQNRVARLASDVTELLGYKQEITDEEILVNDAFLGEGYGIVNKNDLRGIKLFAQYEGILLDPVYTGRAGGGLIHLVENGYFLQDEKVLFIHTGGSPALFAEQYEARVSDFQLGDS